MDLEALTHIFGEPPPKPPTTAPEGTNTPTKPEPAAASSEPKQSLSAPMRRHQTINPEPPASPTNHTNTHAAASASSSNKPSSKHVIKKTCQQDNIEAREERAAIMEFDGGLTRAEAEAAAARLHPDPISPTTTDTDPTPSSPPAHATDQSIPKAIDPAGPWYGYTRADLARIEPDLWPEISHHPETLQAFARALSENPNAPRPSQPS